MKKRAIIVDSGSAPTWDFIKKYDLKFMGMKIIIDDQEFTDGVDITHEKFYELVKNAKEFHTAHPSIGEVKKIYEDLKNEGYEEIVDIHFSSKMTGLHQTCEMVKNMIEGIDIHIIDTKNVSMGSSLITRRIVELLVDKKKSVEEVKEKLPEIRKNTFMQFSVPTLKYLVKNGRIGRATGLVGTLLKIKPILGVDEDGYIAPISKVRGNKKVYEVMAKNAYEFIKDRPYNIKIYTTYGFEHNRENIREVYNIFMEMFKKLGFNYELIEGRIWPTVGCHSGPEVYGLAVYGEKEPID